MWLIMGIPHPTWVVFLSIPIVEWICESIRRQCARRRKAAAAQTGEPVDVEAEPSSSMQNEQDDEAAAKLSIEIEFGASDEKVG
jgi:hypothetical protein